MKLGEKLQRLRRQGGLSQEQLAGQLGVSRQAVSKWELDETMPDTENVLQLSRLFGVSCDYLLREELEEQGAPAQPAAPGETHLDEQGWVHNASALSLAVCAIGLLLALGGWLSEQTSGPLIIGLIVQVLGVLLFALALPRMGGDRALARIKFLKAAVWFLVPIPLAGAWWWAFSYATRPFPAALSWSMYLSSDLMLCGILTGILAWQEMRRR